MSSHSSGAGGRLSAAVDRTRRIAAILGERLPDGARALVRPARWIAFWTAVSIPFLLLAMLVRGLSTPADSLAFVVLVVVELIALLVGHPYRRE